MGLDYNFLHDYLMHEIKRLTRILAGYEESISREVENIAKLEEAVKVAIDRKWEYGHALEKCRSRLLEHDIKKGYIEPKIQKLKEQVYILDNLK